MPTVQATHWICGTTVTTEVPDDYDLEEGVAVACTRCQDVWWHYPLARGPAGQPGVDATIARSNFDPGAPAGESGARPRLATDWLGPAFVLCVLALVLLHLADLGPRATSAPRAGGPAADRTRFVTVAATAFTLKRPAGWVTFARNGATVVAPRTRSPQASVAVYADRRPDLSPAQMEDLVQRLLQTQFPSADVKGPADVALSGLRGHGLTARSGPYERRMVVAAAGEYRYVIQVSARGAAGRAQSGLLARIVRSFRARP